MAPCLICGNPNARKRYNGSVCNACRVFFSRAHSKSFAFCCEFSGSCEISYQKQRVNCAACRFQKCLNFGMSIQGGQNVVENLYMTHATYTPMRTIMAIYGGMMNSGFKIAENMENGQADTAWVDQLSHYDSRVFVIYGPSPSSVIANTSMSLTDLLMFPGSCIDRSTAIIDSVTNFNPKISYSLKETLCRQMVAAVESMSCIPEFHCLPPRDKIILIKQNALMVSAYAHMQIKRASGTSGNTNASMQYFKRFQMTGKVAALWNNVLSMWSSPSYFNLLGLLAELQPTEKEFMIMRIRSFFQSCPELSPEGYATTLEVQLRLANYLGQLIRMDNPSLSQEQIRDRLCKLFEINNYLKVIVDSMYDFYAATIWQQSLGCDSQLLHDIFVRKP